MLNNLRKQTKWQQKGGCYIGGFKFILIDGDYDWAKLVSKKYKYSKQMLYKMQQFKYDYQQDFIRTEYDCNGSTQVRINIKTVRKRNRKFLKLKYYECKDV